MERERRNDAVTELAARLRRELPRLMADADKNVIMAGLRSFNEQIAAVNDAIPATTSCPCSTSTG
jgi:small ligand-binding sensory domain FIST